MKKSLLSVALGAALFAFCSATFTAHAAGELKLGIVDLQRVFSSYYKTDRSSRALKHEAAEMQKERKDIVDNGKKQEDEWQKLIDKSEDQAISADERAKAKKQAEDKFRDVKAAEQMMQEFDRASATKLREKERQRHDDIVKEIRGVLNAVAKEGGYSLVLDTSGNSENTVPVVLYSNGANDITDGVIKSLNAGAPAPVPEDSSDSAAKPAK